MERRDWSDIYVGGTRLEQISEFKYLECVSMDQVQMLPIVIGRWRAREKLRVLSGLWLILGRFKLVSESAA